MTDRSPLSCDASPAARLLALAVSVTAVATAPLNPAALVTALLVTAGLYWRARPRPAWFIHRASLACIAILAIVSPWAFSGQLEQAALRGARALICVATTLSIASTLGARETALALRALHVPEAFARVIAGMLRQLAGLHAEGQRLALARRLRGARGSSVGVDVLAALLDRSMRRAERLELAERLRGFHLRDIPDSVRLRLGDAYLLGILGVLASVPHLSSRIIG